MGRHEKTFIIDIQHDGKQICGIKPKNRASVGFDISDGIKFGIKLFHAFNIRQIDQVMIFPHPVIFLVNIADFRLQKEPDRIPATFRDSLINVFCNLLF